MPFGFLKFEVMILYCHTPDKFANIVILEFKNNYTLTKGKWYYGLYNLSPNADNQTFKIINRSYAKDKKSVFNLPKSSSLNVP